MIPLEARKLRFQLHVCKLLSLRLLAHVLRRVGELLEESDILAHPFLVQWLKRRILSNNHFEESYGAWVTVGEMATGKELQGLAQAPRGVVSTLPPNNEDGSQQLFAPSSEWQSTNWTVVVCFCESAGSLRLKTEPTLVSVVELLQSHKVSAFSAEIFLKIQNLACKKVEPITSDFMRDEKSDKFPQ
jgi:hypothetical protein